MLEVLDHLPDGLLDCDARQLHRVLEGPTLIHLPGRRQRPLFVSVLMHGNEDTGWIAAREVLRKYRDTTLPRAVSLFIGNVAAAREGLRFLDGQPDYNRVWRLPQDEPPTPEHIMMQKVIDEMRAREVFASVDIHNNAGLNPHYACVNRLDHRFFHLAALFGRTVVYFTTPNTVQSIAFATLCPSVTVECGQPGQWHGVEHARDYLEACLHLAEHPDHSIAPHDIDLFHTVAVAKIPETISFSFEHNDCDIRFVEDLEHLNFREIPANTTVGWLGPRTNGELGLDVRDEQGRDVTDHYFKLRDNEIQTALPFMPSMLTVNVRAIRQDCLCYLMERYPAFADQGAGAGIHP